MENINELIRFTKKEIDESIFMINRFLFDPVEYQKLVERIKIFERKLTEFEKKRDLIKEALEFGNIW